MKILRQKEKLNINNLCKFLTRSHKMLQKLKFNKQSNSLKNNLNILNKENPKEKLRISKFHID